MRDHVTRRALPIEQSIEWKPLRDPHYVVASLQASDGGRRKIFIRQLALARVEALVGLHGRRASGLLIGQLYQCPETRTDYLVIESIAEQPPTPDDMQMTAALTEAYSGRSAEQRLHVMGWFRGVPTLQPKPSRSIVATHLSVLDQPWQTTLVLAEETQEGGGAFFLHDKVNATWFCAPFHEMLDHAPEENAPKPTFVNWPQQYITSNLVVAAEPLPPLRLEVADARPKARYEAPSLWQKLKEAMPADAVAPEPAVAPPPGQPAPEALETPTAVADGPVLSDRPIPRQTHPGLADVQEPIRKRLFSRSAPKSGEKLSIVDDRDQRVAATSSRRITDADDTRPSDNPHQYIELARTEGFFIAAKFEPAGGVGEAIWILNEPYSGMLLAVVTTETAVIDATLHYNLQTDEAGLLRVPFPEHRDEASKTIYVRETCIESLRERCRRVRATNALLKEWKVTPKISFVTPAEWESLSSFANATRGSSGVGELNAARIAELPAGVRSQFHLGDTVQGDASA